MPAANEVDPARSPDALDSQATATTLQLQLGEFTTTELRRQAERQGVPVGELAAHAIAYYLADANSGRASWPVPPLGEQSAD